MDQHTILKKSIAGGAISMATMGVQLIIGFVTQIILARLLNPEYFGAMATAVIVAYFFNVLANIHGDKYLIQASEDIQEKFNNVITVEILFALAYCILAIGLAPAIMRYIGSEHLTPYVQVLTLAYFYNPFSRIRSLFEKDLSFFQARIPMVISQLIAASVGITMAYFKFGIWSLVAWRLAALFTEVLVLWWIAPRRPHLALNPVILRQIFQFCWPLMGSAIFIYFYSNIDYYIVGRLLDVTQLGYYWLAFQMTHQINRVRNVINMVLYPTFSKIGMEKKTINKIFLTLSNITFTFSLIPLVILLFYGEATIVFIFGEKWRPATQVFQILTIVTVIRMTFGYWDPIVLYFNRTKIKFFMTIYGGITMAGFVYVFTLHFGMIGAAFGVLLAVTLGTIIYGITFHYMVLKMSYKSLIISLLQACGLLTIGYGVHRIWFPVNPGLVFSLICGAFVLMNAARMREHYSQIMALIRIGR